MKSNIGVISTTKSDFLQISGVPFTVSDDIEMVKGTPNFRKKSLFGVQITPNEIPQVHPLSRSGVIKCVLRDRLCGISTSNILI